MRRVLLLLAAGALTACSMVETSVSRGGGGGGGAGGGGGGGRAAAPGADVVVPDLIGRTPEEAAALIADAGFTQPVESSRPVECEGPPQIDGRVNCQSPAAGEVVKNYTGVQINVYRTQHIAGAVVRSQLLALLGMSPDQARDALASYGHDGLVRVEIQTEYDADCGADRVCGFNVPESGMGIHDAIRLYVNPPPPD